MRDDVDLGELYQEVILDHHRRPQNFRKPEDANRTAAGYNPLCGDRVSVFLKMQGDVVGDIGFQGAGCAISTASASMMTQSVKGKTKAEAEALFEKFRRMVTGDATVKPDELGKLAAFQGLSEFPVRVKCASLAWHTLKAALEAKSETVSTE